MYCHLLLVKSYGPFLMATNKNYFVGKNCLQDREDIEWNDIIQAKIQDI